MKHFVLAYIFNKSRDKVLLMEKLRPDWAAGNWNGVGGKIEDDDRNAEAAMYREAREEIGRIYNFEHVATFICDGGTCYVYRAFSENAPPPDGINFTQIEDEQLKVWPVNALPPNTDKETRWLIPLCLSTIKFPVLMNVDWGRRT